VTREPITADIDEASLRELTRALQRAADKADEGIAAAIRAAAEAAADLERRGAPVRTGTLVASITVNVADDGQSATVGPGGDEVFYAPLVEWGTSTRPATPFCTPAAERARVDFPRAVLDEIRARL